jgi:hypothetical protein
MNAFRLASLQREQIGTQLRRRTDTKVEPINPVDTHIQTCGFLRTRMSCTRHSALNCPVLLRLGINLLTQTKLQIRLLFGQRTDLRLAVRRSLS